MIRSFEGARRAVVRGFRRGFLVVPLLAPCPAMTQTASTPPQMTGRDLLALPQPPADVTIAYGPLPSQKAELRLPAGPGPHPVVILVHGGCWEMPWSFDQLRSLAAAITAEGYATWSLEYRRLGEEGGGWPGTFEDVGRGADHLRAVAAEHRLDLGRVIAVGHSAGGQLALWLVARPRLPAGSPLHVSRPLPLRGVVALAAVADLEAAAAARTCGDAIPRLLPGTPAQRATRAAAVSPIRLLPLGVPQRLVHGRHDRIVPLEQSIAYETKARAAGDDVALETVEDAGHFELVNPKSTAWSALRQAVTALLPRVPRPKDGSARR
jgi:acetyl esterase/lipase